MQEVRQIGVDELGKLVEIASAAQPREFASVDGFVDWRNQAEEMVWLLAERDGEPVGADLPDLRHAATIRAHIRGRPGFDVVGSPAELQAEVPGRPR